MTVKCDRVWLLSLERTRKALMLTNGQREEDKRSIKGTSRTGISGVSVQLATIPLQILGKPKPMYKARGLGVKDAAIR